MAQKLPETVKVEFQGMIREFDRGDLDTAALLLMEYRDAPYVARTLRGTTYGWEGSRVLGTVIAAAAWLESQGLR